MFFTNEKMERRRYSVFAVLVVSLTFSLETLVFPVQSSEVKPIYAIPPSSSVPHSAKQHKNATTTVSPLSKTATSSIPSPSMESMSKESVRQESQNSVNILSPLKLAGHHHNIPESAQQNNQKISNGERINPQYLTSAVPVRANAPISTPTHLFTPISPQDHGVMKSHGTSHISQIHTAPPFYVNANHPLVPVQNPQTNATNNDARSLFPMNSSGVNAVNNFINYVPLDYENGQIQEYRPPNHKRELPRARRRFGRGPPPLQRRSSNSSSPFKNIISSFHDKVSRILLRPRRRHSRPIGPNRNTRLGNVGGATPDHHAMMVEPRRSFTERVDTNIKQTRSNDSPTSFSAALNTVAKLLQNQYVPVMGKRERVRSLSKEESRRIDTENRRHRKPRRRPPPRPRQHPRKRRPHHAPPRHHHPHHHPHHYGNNIDDEEDAHSYQPTFKTHKEHHHHLGLLENPQEEILIQHRPIDRPKKFLGFKDQPHFNDDFYIPAYKESGPPYKAFNSFRSSFKTFRPWKPSFAEFHDLREEHEGVYSPDSEISYKETERYRKKPSWHIAGYDSDEKPSHHPNHFSSSSSSKRPHHHDKHKEYSAESYYDPGMHDDSFRPIKSSYYKSRGKYRDWDDSPVKKPRKFHKVYDYDHGIVGIKHFNHMDTKLKPGASIPAIIKEDSDAKAPKIIINHHHNLPPAASGSSFVPGAAFANPLMSYTSPINYQEDYYSGAGANLPGGSNVGMKRDYKSASEYPESFLAHDYGKPPPPQFGAPPPGFGMTGAPPGLPFGARPPHPGPGPVGHPATGFPGGHMGGPMNSPMAFQNFGQSMPPQWIAGTPQHSPHVDHGHFSSPTGPSGPHAGIGHAPGMSDHFPHPLLGYQLGPQGHPQSEGGFENIGKPFPNHNEVNDPFSRGQHNPPSQFHHDGPKHASPFGEHDSSIRSPSPFSQETPINPSSSPFSQENPSSSFMGNPSSSPFRQENPIGPPSSFMRNHHSSEGESFFGGSHQQHDDFSSERLPTPDASPFPSTNDPKDHLGYIPPFTPVPIKNDIQPTQGPISPSSRESFFRFNQPTSNERNKHSQERSRTRGFDLTVVKTLSAGFDLPSNPLSPTMGNHNNQPEQQKSNLYDLGVPDREHYKNKRQRQRQRQNSNSFRNNDERSREEHHRQPQSKASILSTPRNKIESNDNSYSTLPENWTEFRPDPSHKKLPSLTYDSTEMGSRMYKIKSALTPKGIMKAIISRFPRARFFEKNKGNRAHTKFTPFDAISKSEEERGLSASSRKRRKSVKTPHSIQDIINSDSNNNKEIVVALPEEDAAQFTSTHIVLNEQGEMNAAASGDNVNSEQIQPSSSTPTETVIKVVVQKKDTLPRRRLFNSRFRSVNRSNEPPTEDVTQVVNNNNSNSSIHHHNHEEATVGGERDDMYDDVLLGMQSINVPLTAEIRMGEVLDDKKKKK